MKYLKLFEDFDSYDPYELMMIPPNKKAEMIMQEIEKIEPNLNLVSDLITLGANLEWQDEENDGWTPLHWAAYYGNVEIARMLIGAKVDLNLQDRWGWTPLHRAVSNGEIEIAQMLIDVGANVNMQDEDGWTSLHWAVSNGNIEITKILIDAGASKDILNNDGELPYDLAETEELKKLLKP